MPVRSQPFSFPRNFTWGVAAAAPQIEGAAFSDGKGESVWDRFARQPGAVANGDTLDVACDHYHRFDRDFALMAKLGIKNYRLSLAWPRIFPNGDGAVNQAGVDFYHRIFDAMEKHGITPWVTMFHWDLPQALEDRGGWRTRTIADVFAHYADTIVKAFGPRVKNWITLNEIRCFTLHAYGGGGKAPGVSEGARVVNQTMHHALLCHGHGVRAVREHGSRGSRVGLTDNCETVVPVSETPEDIAAARAWFIEANQPILDPIYNGHYAPAYLRRCGKDRPVVAKGDPALISLPTDFLGLNIYTGTFIRRRKRGKPEVVVPSASYPRTDSPWLNLAPRALYWSPKLAAEVYGIRDIYITENGCGYNDDAVANGECLDLHRVEYLRNYLRELQRATADGAPVRGYFLWSFIDNFEWSDGYTRRFGIVHNDFKTQRRTPKLSAQWYASVMAANRVL
ncbi:GH1 family beta-glucosidase [Oleiharenicola lentus]|uniref:GH1 family beta-glucosidase n=1 Tax=Oleiharenicola lentus TaxID=2508720 RepID=UPI003F679785